MYERMLNKEIKPSIKDLSLYIGSSTKLFHMFNSFLSEKIRTEMLSLPISTDTKEIIKNTAAIGKTKGVNCVKGILWQKSREF